MAGYPKLRQLIKGINELLKSAITSIFGSTLPLRLVLEQMQTK